jgi:hypothetical protein
MIQFITIITVVAAVAFTLWIFYRPTKEQRIHHRYKREIRKFTFKQYDGIFTLMKSFSKAWGTERIPLETAKLCIEKAYIIGLEADPITLKKVEGFNKSLDIFIKVLQTQSQETMNDGKISISEIKMFIDKFKQDFVRFQEEDNVPQKNK